jgi:hypothetical protein
MTDGWLVVVAAVADEEVPVTDVEDAAPSNGAGAVVPEAGSLGSTPVNPPQCPESRL